MRAIIIGLASLGLLCVGSVAPALGHDSLGFDDLRRAVERTVEQETARIDALATWEMPGSGLGASTLMDVTGQATFGTDRRTWLEGTMEELGKVGFVEDGSDIYIRLDAFDDTLGPGTYVHVDTSSPPPGFEDLREGFEVGDDTALALYWLLGVDGSVTTLGSEEIDGARAIRVEAPIDLALVRAHVPAWLLPVYEQNLAEMSLAGGVVDHAEAWIDEDGLIRRIAYDMSLSLGDDALLMRVEYDLSDFGDPIDLPLPDPEDVVDAWELVGG